MVPTTTTMAMMNEMRHSVPSIPLSNPCLREGKGKYDAMRVRMAVIVVGGGGKDIIVVATINCRHS